MADNLQIERFNAKMQRAMDRVRVVLGAEKAPQFASDVHHQYEDKYLLAERVTNAACASQLNCLRALGLMDEQLATLRAWCAGGSVVSLRFRAEQRCSFVREVTREQEGATRHMEEVAGIAGQLQAAFASTVVTTVTEFLWRLTSSYEIVAIRGVGQEPGDRLVLAGRAGEVELTTSAKSPPHPEARAPAVQCEVSITWLLQQLPSWPDDAASFRFRIDRAHARCLTPRRNPDVEAGFEHFVAFARWAQSVSHFADSLLQIQPDQTRQLDLGGLRGSPVFAPLLPLMTEGPEGLSQKQAEAAADGASAVVAAADGASTAAPAASGMLVALDTRSPSSGCAAPGAADMNRLLAEEARALCERIGELRQGFPDGGAIATAAEAVLVVILGHCAHACEQWADVLDYVEGLIRRQLVAAIGKEVTPADFAEYMQFHSRKLFAEPYVPAPFCYAVRRSNRHSPEGTLSIEERKVFGGPMALPVVTMAARSARGCAERPMEFPLNASTTIRFGGEVHLHAYLSHQFSGHSGTSLSLVSRARQFSSFLVLVGRIASANVFEPRHAAIVQNKDELTIPLDMSTIPTPKEFRDAIESLSPEQQRFARAFRAMQLQSTLFGILVIQIKPQLERVLDLPPDSLTKEIKLTQDLMELFIEYQIPSDLLSFDAGDAESGAEIVGAESRERLEAVRQHVKSMRDMIDDAKKSEVEEAARKAAFEQPLQEHSTTLGGSDLLGSGDGLAGGGMMGGFFGGGAFGGAELHNQRAVVSVSKASSSLFGSAPAEPAASSSLFGSAPSAPAAASGLLFGSASPAPAAAPSSTWGWAAPPMQQQQQQQQQQKTRQTLQQDLSQEGRSQPGARDYTRVPKEMDERFEALDADGALRPTIISAGDVWSKRVQKALLAGSLTESTLFEGDQKREKDAAFDLLDALTKSGALPVEGASLHVVVAATHCFDNSVMETVVKESVDPIEKVERSLLIMASTIHQKPCAALIQDSQRDRVAGTSPTLFLQDSSMHSSTIAAQ